jgi:hypothetical protein
VLVADALEQLMAGDAATACRTFAEAQAIGRRFADTDLHVMGIAGRGMALIQLGLAGDAAHA